MSEKWSRLAELAPYTYGFPLPQAIYMPEEKWQAARKEVCEFCEEKYGLPIPFVNREFTDAAIPHFLFRMIPVVPI